MSVRHTLFVSRLRFEGRRFRARARRRSAWVHLFECEECHGDGVCNGCAGNGRVLVRFGLPLEACDDCNGSGGCPVCGGRGRLKLA